MPPKKKNQTVIHEFACEIFPRKLWIVKKPPHGYLEKHFQTADGEKLHEYDVDDAKAVTYKEIYNIDTDKLAEAFSKPRRSPREILNLRLLRGSIFTLCGLGFVIFGLVGLANDFTIRMEPVMIPMICGASCLAVGISSTL